MTKLKKKHVIKDKALDNYEEMSFCLVKSPISKLTYSIYVLCQVLQGTSLPSSAITTITKPLSISL